MDYFTEKVWHVIRTLAFYLIGLMNTIFISPGDLGSFMNYAGYIFLLLAVFDTYVLIRNWNKDCPEKD